jgi:hypothetical protein
MFAQRAEELNACLCCSRQSGGVLCTTVYVDGSYWEKTRQAGSGVYFATPAHLTERGWIDVRSGSFACPDYRSALGAELFASYQALLLYVEESYPHERVDRSAAWWRGPAYEEPTRLLVIRQDCQKAIRMIRFCLAEQNHDRFQRQQYERDLKLLHRRIAGCREELSRLQRELTCAQELDLQTHAHASAWARSMGVVPPPSYTSAKEGSRSQAVQSRRAATQQELERCESELKTRFAESYTCSNVSTPLARLFAARSPAAVVDASHARYSITMADLFEHLPLLECIVSIVHMHLFEVRWEYVKGHQARPSAGADDDMGDVPAASVPQHTYSRADHRGNDCADGLAKEGSRKCNPVVASVL